MLVNLKTILNLAEVKKCAVGAFNTPNYESIRAVTGAAEELNQPLSSCTRRYMRKWAFAKWRRSRRLCSMWRKGQACLYACI